VRDDEFRSPGLPATPLKTASLYPGYVTFRLRGNDGQNRSTHQAEHAGWSSAALFFSATTKALADLLSKGNTTACIDTHVHDPSQYIAAAQHRRRMFCVPKEKYRTILADRWMQSNNQN
jgi:hypothetical protein